MAAGQNCPACALLAENAPISEMDGVVVILGPGEAAPESLHLVLREHLNSLNDLPWKWYLELQQLRQEGTIALQSLWSTERIRVIDRSRAEGLCEGTVHLHLELRPVLSGETAFPDEEGASTSSLLAEPSHTRIRRKLSAEAGDDEALLRESDRRKSRRA